MRTEVPEPPAPEPPDPPELRAPIERTHGVAAPAQDAGVESSLGATRCELCGVAVHQSAWAPIRLVSSRL